MDNIQKCTNSYRKYTISYLILCLFFFALTELLHRTYIKEFGYFLTHTNPLVLCYLLLFFVFSSIYVFLFNRPIILCTIHYTYWCVLSIISNLVTFFRYTPLVFEDFFLIGEATEIASKYINKTVIVNFFLLFVCIILINIILIRYFYNIKLNIFKFRNKCLNLCARILFLFIFLISSNYLFDFGKHITYVVSDFDIMDTYNKNGFMYSFYKSTESFLSNIDNPNYDINKITEIKNVINQQKNDGIPKENIILIQLESLFDPLKLNHVELSKDPLENFHKLMDRYTHGEIIVPVIGGGTTQTEFEILTGIDTKKLFTKMPYLNLLNHNPVESIANIFKNYGYSTTAIHNYFSSFYNRVRAYENLGFDTFIPLETISDRNKNENFWYKDDLMINEIKNRILSTNEKDFIFGVTVEAHGPYNTEINGDIKVKSDVLDDKEKNELQNYVNIINNTDKFISNLIDTLNEIGEDYILIMYSDHLPSLGYQHSTFNKTLDIDDLFKTPYLIITSDENKRMDMENTLYSYEFIGSVLNYLNLDSTIYHKFRHYFSNNENSIEYENQLLMDIKYKNIYDDSLFPYKIQKIQIGNSLPEINNIVIENNIIYIIGENFTPNSKVFVNKDLKDSEYISENYIKLNGYVLKINDTVNLVTFSNKNSPLNSSKSFEFLG